MNILFIGREFPFPPDSGVKQRAWYVLERLARKHNVHLLCYGQERDRQVREVQSVLRSVDVVPPPARGKGLGLYCAMLAGLFYPLPFSVQSRVSPELRKKIDALLAAQPIDMIVCDSLYQAVQFEENGRKVILNEHNIESVIIKRYQQVERNPWRKLYAAYEGWRMERFETRIWCRYKNVWVCSPVDRDEVLRRAPKSRVEVIPNGVRVPVLNKGGRDIVPKSLVYTGLIGWHPNEDAVLFFVRDIYPLIKQRVPGVKFWVVGKDPTERIKRLAAQDGSITVTGFVDDVRAYIEKAEVFVVPLRIGSGTRLKILEAMAMKKAVISTAVGCEGLAVRDQENICIADDALTFARRVVELLDDEKARKRLEENGRALIEKEYSWDVIGDKIAAVVDELP
ncbi:MAG TPA: glycosyltransferase family 4 protein [Candidatus Omnitrophota bacterium]|nr:glycosyltransferase family 4 protein [Candidatus Omnitrophota bacterium]HPN57357.1 glycosyltransferase family 4 protein [Candidatus Omnitrophota bacterium]